MKITVDLTDENIRRTKQLLMDIDVEPDEVDTVLQAIGYTLLDAELEPLLWK